MTGDEMEPDTAVGREELYRRLTEAREAYADLTMRSERMKAHARIRDLENELAEERVMHDPTNQTGALMRAAYTQAQYERDLEEAKTLATQLQSRLETAREINQFQRGRIVALEAELATANETIDGYRSQIGLHIELAAARSALIDELIARLPTKQEDTV
jgi:predicted  nucleic acid-binding Zn-ribbon protein